MSAKSFALAPSGFFNLTLSRAHCNALLRTSKYAAIGPDAMLCGLNVHTMNVMRELEARGLIFWNDDVLGKFEGFGGLTDAGRTTVELLAHAGLTIENTDTTSVLNRLERLKLGAQSA